MRIKTGRYPDDSAYCPHIAAKAARVTLSVAKLTETLTPILTTPADVTLIEGAGGWLLPLNDTETLADYVQLIRPKIILVVKMQLGCLNHALLTAQDITNRGLSLAGWVANTINEPMPHLEENIAFLSAWFKLPPLNISPTSGTLNDQ